MVWLILGGLVLLGLAWVFPLAAVAVLLVAVAYSIGRWERLDGVPEWGRYALVATAAVALIGQFIIGPNTQDDEDDPYSPSSQGGSGPLLCPSELEAIAERRGGGFVDGVDPEYDPRMDWDDDGVSCE